MSVLFASRRQCLQDTTAENKLEDKLLRIFINDNILQRVSSMSLYSLCSRSGNIYNVLKTECNSNEMDTHNAK